MKATGIVRRNDGWGIITPNILHSKSEVKFTSLLQLFYENLLSMQADINGSDKMFENAMIFALSYFDMYIFL